MDELVVGCWGGVGLECELWNVVACLSLFDTARIW
jgi:hypothetical protein